MAQAIYQSLKHLPELEAEEAVVRPSTSMAGLSSAGSHCAAMACSLRPQGATTAAVTTRVLHATRLNRRACGNAL
jgi:hypothetical protein